MNFEYVISFFEIVNFRPNHFIFYNVHHFSLYNFTGQITSTERSIFDHSFIFDYDSLDIKFTSKKQFLKDLITNLREKQRKESELRIEEYEKKVQLQPHWVYLALSSHLKVGVTRKSQIPTRWIDQGAHQALGILELPNRYLAGVAEVSLKEYFSDKTNWRKMLQNHYEEVPWEEAINQAIENLPKDLKPYLTIHHQLTELQFPVLQYPNKVKSLNLEKEKSHIGVLKGIKGQYLIFEDQTVFNIRSNEGTVVEITIN